MKLNIKKILFFASFFYISIFSFLFLEVYFSPWYEFNYGLQGTYSELNNNLVHDATYDLIGYFWHQGELGDIWSAEEKIHFQEVRNIYDVVLILMAVFVVLFVLLFDKKSLELFAKINLILIVIVVLVFPFFSFFWENIFHNLLFSNNFYLMESDEISFYLFPINFFRNSLVFILLGAILVNLSFIFDLKKLFPHLFKKRETL